MFPSKVEFLVIVVYGERGDVVLRTSHKTHNFGRLYYGCPRLKPSQQYHGCGYFKWKDEINFGNAKCSNCKLLTIKIKIPEARLAMERHPKDHAYQSAAILHELLNERKPSQKNTLAEYMILFGADNHPPMLDKDLPLIWPTIEENGVARAKKYAELSAAEKIQADCDMKAANIILQGDDLISCLNKAMAFLTAVAYSSSGGNNASGQAKVVKCYNYQDEGHMARQCTQPKRPRNATWYKDKSMLVEAQEAGQILDEEQLAFLADPGVLDTILMANISNYGSNVISKKAQRIKPTVYDGIVIYNKHVAMPVIDDEETLILEELYVDFVKRFVPQQELSIDKAFWYHMLNPSTKSSDALHVKIEAPEELLKVLVITSLKNDLRKVKGKEIVDIATQIPSANTIVPGMFKLDLDPLAPKLLQNKEAHIDYLKYTQEQADILLGIVEQAKAKQPLDNPLNFPCKHAQRIYELLVYVRDTCPNAIKLSAKKVAATPKNNVKKVRFTEPLTSSSNIKHVESSKTSDSNTHVLSPIGLKCSTSNCRSKPTGNKKNDRISQTPSRNMKNKVEAQPRKVNKKNRVVKPICDVDVKHLLLNENSKLICATCMKSMFNGVHDMCLLDFVENVNSRAKSAKKHKKQNMWKPTGHVFTEVGLKWKPTGRTFTIAGNSCPLTRITSANVVPPKKTTSHSVETQKPKLKVYNRKPKNVKIVGLSKKAKIVESNNANLSHPAKAES
uniref:Integrase, catalytic region, zinc finger, CCHC-type, peptidase aspartic, catalytic n=1 Tax=Tanacetum cinerariifolium TaxID=118510 RepID=A0A6L2KN33_TANCI|nr:integrase, catalytic region, zinc finger, CCHC-type, peptidase aspartic, catalytic [Tanacetum cinerariifolium]